MCFLIRKTKTNIYPDVACCHGYASLEYDPALPAVSSADEVGAGL